MYVTIPRYRLMLMCWAHSPKKRPSFSKLYDFLSQVHASQTQDVSTFEVQLVPFLLTIRELISVPATFVFLKY